MSDQVLKESHSSLNPMVADQIPQAEMNQRLKESNSSPNPSVADRIRLLYSNELYSDVQFVLRDKNSKSVFPAHRNILAIGSPVFAEMLYSEQINTIQSFPISVSIENLSYDSFGNVIEFLYTDDTYLENISLAAETLVAARKFEVSGLIKHCEDFLEAKTLSEENVCSVLQLANSMKIDRLKERSLKYIKEHTQNVIKSNDFLDSSLITLKSICTCEKLSLTSEVELFEALVKWAVVRKGQLRNLLQSLLKHIRFLTISAAEFGTLIEKYAGFFTEREALSIMVKITNPRISRDLPEWCNKAVNNRCVSGLHDNVSNVSLHDKMKNVSLHDNVRILISLMPCCQLSNDLSSLTSVLKVRCLYGKYELQTIKMEFRPIYMKECFMELKVAIIIYPSGFNLNQNLKVRSSGEISFDFGRRVLFGKNDKLSLTVKATNIQKYGFMQFDAQNSFSEPNSPFTCNVSSIPNENHLFMIKELLFKSLRSMTQNF